MASATLLLDEFPEETVETAALEIDEPVTAGTVSRLVAERQTGIGGSDAGAVCGLNPYRTPLEVWLEKTGLSEPADLSNVEAVIWGNKLEAVVAAHYAELTGRRVHRVNRCLRSKEHPFMIAHIDRRVVGEKRILECKTTSAYAKADEWGDGIDSVPDHYYLQCQHYLAVTEAEVCDLAVLVGGNRFRIYEIERRADIIADMTAQEAAFWQSVQDREEPSIDFAHPSALEMIRKRYPGTSGEAVKLTGEALEAHAALRSANSRAAEAKHEADQAKATILAAMGDAAVAILPSGDGYTRKLITRKGYTVDETSYVDFRYAKKVID